MGMHKNVGVLMVWSYDGLENLHHISSKIGVVSHTEVQGSVRLIDV
jgi:hypothetical protein